MLQNRFTGNIALFCNRFNEAKLKKLSVYDRDIRRWALLKAQAVNLIGFKASEKWLREFKSKHRIVSRKITKFVSKSDVVNRSDNM